PAWACRPRSWTACSAAGQCAICRAARRSTGRRSETSGVTGLCLAVGAPESGRAVGAMLRRLSPDAGRTATAAPMSGVTLGRSAHGRLPSETELNVEREGLTVAVDGDIFDEHGPVERPGDVIADLYRRGRADRIAWLN